MRVMIPGAEGNVRTRGQKVVLAPLTGEDPEFLGQAAGGERAHYRSGADLREAWGSCRIMLPRRFVTLLALAAQA